MQSTNSKYGSPYLATRHFTSLHFTSWVGDITNPKMYINPAPENMQQRGDLWRDSDGNCTGNREGKKKDRLAQKQSLCDLSTGHSGNQALLYESLAFRGIRTQAGEGGRESTPRRKSNSVSAELPSKLGYGQKKRNAQSRKVQSTLVYKSGTPVFCIVSIRQLRDKLSVVLNDRDDNAPCDGLSCHCYKVSWQIAADGKIRLPYHCAHTDEPSNPTFSILCCVCDIFKQHQKRCLSFSFVQNNPLHVLPAAFECIKHICIIQIKEHHPAEENRLGPAAAL
ncbi:hypothetical protein DPX16_15504 [Anabarilius grahami]|uniref:Uncharacterized protein n=1 Tax=Anabarilius grahami TaxID=495550 RepID=A0A3N0XCJ4_ANAGA|nr:hypothetical protein DPX16_15504 [Anabarilius grahami]